MELQQNTVVAERFLDFIEGERAKMAEAYSRFEREAKAAAQLHSPYVVRLGKRLARNGGRLPTKPITTKPTKAPDLGS
jgi:hypothetical protein